MLLSELKWIDEGGAWQFVLLPRYKGRRLEIWRRKVDGDYGFMIDNGDSSSRRWAHGPYLDALEAQAVLYHYLNENKPVADTHELP